MRGIVHIGIGHRVIALPDRQRRNRSRNRREQQEESQGLGSETLEQMIEAGRLRLEHGPGPGRGFADECRRFPIDHARTMNDPADRSQRLLDLSNALTQRLRMTQRHGENPDFGPLRFQRLNAPDLVGHRSPPIQMTLPFFTRREGLPARQHQSPRPVVTHEVLRAGVTYPARASGDP